MYFLHHERPPILEALNTIYKLSFFFLKSLEVGRLLKFNSFSSLLFSGIWE